MRHVFAGAYNLLNLQQRFQIHRAPSVDDSTDNVRHGVWSDKKLRVMNNYDNSRVRRQDRLLSEDMAEDVLREGEYGFLSMVDCHNAGYGIPVNYVWDGEAIYLHGALDGEKIRAITLNPQVSFCVVGQTRVIPDKFTTEYQSVLIRGRATVESDDALRRHAVELILDKYSPEDKILGMKYAERSLPRTSIIRIEIESVSGKSKSVQHG